jgi:hypothetical protein
LVTIKDSNSNLCCQSNGAAQVAALVKAASSLSWLPCKVKVVHLLLLLLLFYGLKVVCCLLLLLLLPCTVKAFICCCCPPGSGLSTAPLGGCSPCKANEKNKGQGSLLLPWEENDGLV